MIWTIYARCYPGGLITEREARRLTKAVEQAVQRAVDALSVSINWRLQRIERQLAIEAQDARESAGGRPC